MRMSFSVFVAIVIVVGLSSPTAGKTWWVKPDGTGDVPTIQAGIDAAVDGDTVLLANGTYTGDGNRDMDYNGKAIVVRSIHGDPSLCIIDCEGTEADPHRGFYFHTGEGPLSILDGVTIKNGYASPWERMTQPTGPGSGIDLDLRFMPFDKDGRRETVSQGLGGAIACGGGSWQLPGASPTLKHCRFTDNSGHGAVYVAFGDLTITNCTFSDNCNTGLYCGYRGRMTITDCRFSGNSGAGLELYDSNVTITRCEFSDNTGDGMRSTYGDITANACTFSGNGDFGVGMSQPRDLRASNCKFLHNTRLGMGLSEGDAYLWNCTFSDNSGSALYCAAVSLEATNCVFSRNDAGDFSGGAVAMGGVSNSIKLVKCIFSRNSGSRGGALEANWSSVQVTDCSFIENWATDGGAVFIHGRYDEGCTLQNCLLYGNKATRGGGVYVNLDGPYGGPREYFSRISNCTLYRNLADEGGGVFVDGSASLTLENNIIAFGEQGAAVYWNQTGAFDPSLTCSDVYGNVGGDWVGCIAGQDGTNGNFSRDPLFCNPGEGDFTLRNESPCLPGNHPDGANCGLIGAREAGCSEIHIALDIKPGSCPNPLNTKPFDKSPKKGNPKKGGVLPVAVLGAGDLDVADINVSTLRLEGVTPLRHGYEDVAASVTDGDGCECTTAGADGYVDLTLKFQKSEIVATLGGVSNGDVVELTLEGQLNDGTRFTASDCVTVLAGKPNLSSFSGDEVVLGSAVPNPFNPVTRISYVLPNEEFVRLSVFDVAGMLVEQLVARTEPAGEHVVEWNGNDLPSGVYFYRLTAGDRTLTRKAVLVR